jgi:transposase-like protein
LPTGASLRSLVRGNTHAGFWSRGGQSDLSIDCNWSLLRSWLRPHRGIAQEKLPLYLGFFEFVHNVRKRGKALLGALLELLVSQDPEIQ